jgi:hypothetical protein
MSQVANTLHSANPPPQATSGTGNCRWMSRCMRFRHRTGPSGQSPSICILIRFASICAWSTLWISATTPMVLRWSPIELTCKSDGSKDVPWPKRSGRNCVPKVLRAVRRASGSSPVSGLCQMLPPPPALHQRLRHRRLGPRGKRSGCWRVLPMSCRHEMPAIVRPSLTSAQHWQQRHPWLGNLVRWRASARVISSRGGWSKPAPAHCKNCTDLRWVDAKKRERPVRP